MISVSHLTKLYGSHAAVNDLSFTIEKGRIYGFLGPNGAGKSTTMNILTGCLAATGGEVKIGGYDIYENPTEAKKLIGYLPEIPPLYTDMTPKEYLLFVGRAKGLKGAELKADVQRVTDVTGIADVSSRLIKNLSKGYRQRVGIAQALLGKPEVVILDEPTVGLDPKQIIEIRDLIKELGKEHTVILSSHILSEVSAVCDEIMIISNGRLVASDTAENLQKLLRVKNNIRLSVHADDGWTRMLLGQIKGIDDIKTLSREGDVTTFAITGSGEAENLPEKIADAMVGSKIKLRELALEKASLEDIFLELTENDVPAEDTVTEAPEAPAEPAFNSPEGGDKQ